MSTSITSRMLGAVLALSLMTPVSMAQAIVTATPAHAVVVAAMTSAATCLLEHVGDS